MTLGYVRDLSSQNLLHTLTVTLDNPVQIVFCLWLKPFVFGYPWVSRHIVDVLREYK